jgi:hypothetical protein
LRDDEKPRRSRVDELAEIKDFESRKHVAAEERLSPVPSAVNPELSLGEIVVEMEADDEAAFQARERAETPEEREESARIRMVEAAIATEIPALRARELQKTFSRPAPAYAAAAMA